MIIKRRLVPGLPPSRRTLDSWGWVPACVRCLVWKCPAAGHHQIQWAGMRTFAETSRCITIAGTTAVQTDNGYPYCTNWPWRRVRIVGIGWKHDEGRDIVRCGCAQPGSSGGAGQEASIWMHRTALHCTATASSQAQAPPPNSTEAH